MIEGGHVQSQSNDITEALDKSHPITRTSDRFSLYDRFHQLNQKQEKEKLRSLDLVPELTGLINSSMAEQLNRELANSRYFLCQLKDVHYMFALRLVFHLHNSRVNKSFMEKMLRQTQGAAEVGLDGRLSLFTTYTDSRLQNPERQGNVKEKESISGKGLHFSTSLFPVLKENKLSELYSTVQNDASVLVRVDNCIATLKDIQTIIPAQSISSQSQDILPQQPWLTDDVCTFFWGGGAYKSH
ncbi:hypothetical protein ABG768_018736 [Culter alburnus]|uniref:Uncharacterized protein n=1 Tax=Culter alburnus TaxID=194366 RepID=A0AAW2AW89_CULAL